MTLYQQDAACILVVAYYGVGHEMLAEVDVIAHAATVGLLRILCVPLILL